VKGVEGMKEPVLWEAVEYYGAKDQMLKAIEECGELIVALAKEDMENIPEEIADVRIMLDQIEIILGVDTWRIRLSKLDRLSERIQAKGREQDC